MTPHSGKRGGEGECQPPSTLKAPSKGEKWPIPHDSLAYFILKFILKKNRQKYSPLCTHNSRPANNSIRQIWQIDQKLLKNPYSQQKTRDLPSKSYCWSQNLLGTSCLGANTISTSAQQITYNNSLIPTLICHESSPLPDNLQNSDPLQGRVK